MDDVTRFGRPAASFAAGSIALVMLIFACVKLQLAPAGASLLFLTLVVFVSLAGGFIAATAISILAVASLQYYFIEPRFSFRLADPLNGVELLVFLTTAFTISRLVARARRREQETHNIMDAVPANVAVGSTPASIDLYSNKHLREYTGLSLEEIGSAGLEAIIHPDDRASYEEASRTASAAGAPFETEIRLRNSRGEYRWFLRRVVPMRDEKDHVTWCATSVDIDDHKRAAKRMREQAGLLDLTHDTIFARDLADVITYWNRGAEELYGWKAEEAIGQITHELMKTVFPAPLEKIQDQLLATGRWDGDLIHTKRDGTQVIVASRWALQRDTQGNPVAILETNNDISARRSAEQALRESEEKWKEVFAHNPTMYFIVDESGTVISVNDFGAAQLGYRVEELVGRSVLDVFYGEDREAVQKHAAGCLQHFGETFQWELRKVRKDGRTIWVRETGKAVMMPNRPVVLIVCEDITERKVAEDLLREKARLLDLSHDAIFVRDTNDVITYWNRGSEQIYGWTAEEALGKISHELMHTIFPRPLDEITAELMTAGRWEGELVHTRRDGKNVTAATRWSLQRDAEGRLIGTLETNNDITARKRAEEEIRQLHDQLYRENIALRDEVDRTSMFEEIVGSSAALRKVLNSISKVAATDSTVLITGETGTGKELVARAIHKRSNRSARAFVSINCAAVPQSLIASELFGHEKGAFTGASQRRLGRFELANGGTIFLDEVGELPAETQVALLRVLQERDFERVGGTQRVSVDVRVLAATNRNLKAAVDAGSFRRDLFYRLNVFPVHVPPLRERSGDIPVLVEYFIQRYASKTGKKIRNIEKKTVEAFQEYEWPGNIRELQNVVERAVILCENDTFAVDDNWLQRETADNTDEHMVLPSAILEHEREMIEAALKASRGRVAGPTGAAARLGIPRSTLESKIRTLRIDKHQFRLH